MNKDLKLIKGIGPKKEELLNEKGIFDIKDLLLFYPNKFEDRSMLKKVKDLKDGEYAYLELKVLKKYRTFFYGKNNSQSRIKAKDDNEINIIWYNQRFILKNLTEETTYKFYGIYQAKYKALINPQYCKLNEDIIGGIYPIYSAIKGVSNKELIKYIKSAFEISDIDKEDIFDKNFLERNNILEYKKSLWTIHFPTNKQELDKAISCIQIRDLVVIQLAKRKFITPSKNPIKFDKYNIDDFMNCISFELSSSQLEAFNEIYDDMTSYRRMNRLLQGDVGSGKTIVSILASMVAINSGYQVAFMAPTEILAKQHFLNYKKVLENKGVKSSLLIGQMSQSERKSLLRDLESGDIDICFGTHALFQKDVTFKKLGLVITDEQQRFGVNQRKLLSDKGEDVDILVLSATPIPRTLALSIYGDLSLSEIDTRLPNRKKIDTFAVDYRYEERIMKWLEKNILNKGQAYVVCPAIDMDSEKANVEEVYVKYKKYFKDYKVDYLHGKMDSSEKEYIMEEFNKGNIDILISTTVIEVGIDVKNANIMVIYDANNFGMSQLHQLRGRVGRGERKSFCVLLADKNQNFEKLKFLEENDNGFDIAQKDLQYRGRGEIFGTKQHGINNIKSSEFWLDEKTIEKSIEIVNKEYNDDRNINENLKIRINEELKRLDKIVLN